MLGIRTFTRIQYFTLSPFIVFILSSNHTFHHWSDLQNSNIQCRKVITHYFTESWAKFSEPTTHWKISARKKNLQFIIKAWASFSLLASMSHSLKRTRRNFSSRTVLAQQAKLTAKLHRLYSKNINTLTKEPVFTPHIIYIILTGDYLLQTLLPEFLNVFSYSQLQHCCSLWWPPFWKEPKRFLFT